MPYTSKLEVTPSEAVLHKLCTEAADTSSNSSNFWLYNSRISVRGPDFTGRQSCLDLTTFPNFLHIVKWILTFFAFIVWISMDIDWQIRNLFQNQVIISAQLNLIHLGISRLLFSSIKQNTFGYQHQRVNVFFLQEDVLSVMLIPRCN